MSNGLRKREERLARGLRVWLDLTLGLGVVFGALAVLLMLVSPFVMGPDRQAEAVIEVMLGDGALIPVERLEIARQVPGKGFSNARLVRAIGELRVDTAHWEMFVASMSPRIIVLLAVMSGVWMMRGVVVSVIDGRPFDRRNGRRIRAVGWIMVGMGIVYPLSQYVVGSWLLSRIEIVGSKLTPVWGPNTDAITGGLLIVLLGAVFGHGARIEEERALTI
jgi:hypothetical protein